MSLRLDLVTTDNVDQVMDDFISEYNPSMHCRIGNNECPSKDTISFLVTQDYYFIYGGFDIKKNKYVAIIVLFAHKDQVTEKISDIKVNLLLINPSDFQEFMRDKDNTIMPLLEDQMSIRGLSWHDPKKRRLWGVIGKPELARSARDNKFLKEIPFDEEFQPLKLQKKVDKENKNLLKNSYIFNFEQD